ncbi:MAG: cytochrome P450 [Bdellovibrionota bacterium]
MEATIEMSVYIYELMQWRKKEIAQIYDKYKSSLDDKLIPLDMLGRLLWYQIANQDPARTGLPELLKNHFKGAMGRDVLTSLLKDDRIRSNVFGTVTGAGVNPEEANMRVISSWLNLKEGIIPIKGSASFAGISKYLGRNLKDITLELLRLDPQGEVLLRAPAKDYEFDDDGRNDYSIKFFAGQKVLLAHGSAMFDENVIDDPCSFNMQRASESGASSQKAWNDGDDSRDYEELQSSVYLQHGIGRHICLGRYASEITMQEVLRGFAVFDAKHNLKIDETHRGEILDGDGLYVNSFWLVKK